MKWTIKAFSPANGSVSTYVIEAPDERSAILKSQANGMQVLSSTLCAQAVANAPSPVNHPAPAPPKLPQAPTPPYYATAPKAQVIVAPPPILQAIPLHPTPPSLPRNGAKQTSGALLAVAILQLIGGLVLLALQEGGIPPLTYAIVFGSALLFFGLYIWSRFQPFIAAIVGLGVYVSLLLKDAIVDPSSIGKGLLIKVAIICALAKAVQSAWQTRKACAIQSPLANIPALAQNGKRRLISATVGGSAAVVAIIGFFILRSPASAGMSTTAPNHASSVPNSFTPDQLFAACAPSVVQIELFDDTGALTATGSGFVVTPDGLIVTNHHVPAGASRATAHFSDNRTLPVIGSVAFDQNVDLCILKVQATGLPCLTLAAEQPPAVGTTVFAIGNPKGMTSTLSNGLVSAIRDLDGHGQVIQTNAAVSHGSSGGPLLSSDGRVVGVISSGLAEGQNLNFAVPVKEVRRLLNQQSSVVQALPKEPVDRETQRVLAVLKTADQMIASGDYSGALTQLESVEPQAKGTAVYWRMKGSAQVLSGRFNEALESYRHAVRIAPDLSSMVGIGLASQKLGHTDDAIDAYRKAMQDYPNEALAAECLASILLESKQYQEVVDTVGLGLKSHPDDFQLLLLGGTASDLLGRFSEALVLLQRAQSIKPNDLSCHLMMGIALDGTRRHDEAIAQWQEVIRLDSSSKEASLARKLLQQP